MKESTKFENFYDVMKKLMLLILALTGILPTYGEEDIGTMSNRLRSGDLIFETEGISSFSKAITEVTAHEDSLKFVHVGIVEVTDSVINIIEASPESGVRIIGLLEFLGENSDSLKKKRFVAKRLMMDYPVEKMIKRAKSHLGEPYDWWYLPDNGKMYCSELVYECYEDYEGNKIFETKPMNFLDSDGEMPEFWEELFQRIGSEVPQGMQGTNPNDLSKDKSLRNIE